MPRLFDLLPDNTRKELISEAKKGKKKKQNRRNGPVHRKAPAQKNVQQMVQNIAVPDFVALDVETTGLDFKNDRIIEVGAIRFIEGKPEEEFSTLINAGVPIPEHITRLTSIRNEDIRNAPSFSDVAVKLLEFIGHHPLCGHQIEFDSTFINAELKRLSFPTISPQHLDTALLSRILLQPLGRFSLKHVSASLSVSLDNAHRALHDAKASGEVAAVLIPRLSELPIEVRQTMAACAPGSLFKKLVIKTLGGTRSMVNLSGGKVYQSPPRLAIPEWHLEIEIKDVEDVFSDEEKLGSVVENFIPRHSQKEMALSVTHALNGGSFLVAEAGTGTGKSMAYLIPAAKHALKNNCRVLISTRTRNLQDQLLNNDLPAAAAISGGKLRYSALKGRSNYLCRSRFFKLLRGELGNLSPRERNAVLPLVVWSQTTETGDIEEQNQFNPKWFSKIWNLISSESQDCMGRRCPHYNTCFLHKARQEALGSHIVVINHALFYSDICSENSFLGDVGSIIFDEAHHLESSGHRHLRTELDTHRMILFIDQIQNLLQSVSACKEYPSISELNRSIKTNLKHLRKRSKDFLTELDAWAASAAPESEAEYQIGYDENSLQNLIEPSALDLTLSELQDTFCQLKQMAMTISDKKCSDELQNEIQACSERTSQLRADLQYLINGRTEDHVFWIEGNHEKKWTKLCGVPLDISTLLSQIWDRCTGGVIFTSATLAAQGSTEYFRRAAGLDMFADRTESIVFPSPYNHAQMLSGGIKESPAPDSQDYPLYVADAVASIHSQLKKNTLVLFTSNSMLNKVYSQLKTREDIDQNCLLAQGYSGNRNAMLEQFKSSKGMILLGTDSFWEGVDVPGESCEVVIMPRLPFPVPTHPLTRAVARKKESLNGESFFSFSVPEAIIKFRQGAGRLIRSASDRGALIVLDNRILTKGYGKQFIRALESEFHDFESMDNMVEMMKSFFQSEVDTSSSITYVPFEDL
ncbi:MAG: helicase C-terminal domain-containing protein [Chitinispirillaceae bacterium]